MSYYESLRSPEPRKAQAGNFIVELGPTTKVTLTSSEIAHAAWQKAQAHLARLNSFVPQSKEEKPGILEKMVNNSHKSVQILGWIGVGLAFLSPRLKVKHMNEMLRAQRDPSTDYWHELQYKQKQQRRIAAHMVGQGVDAEHTVTIAPLAVPLQGRTEISYGDRAIPTEALETRLREIQDGRDFGQEINPTAIVHNMLQDAMEEPARLEQRLEALYPGLMAIDEMQQRQVDNEVPDPDASYGVMQGLAQLVELYDIEMAAETEGARVLTQAPNPYKA